MNKAWKNNKLMNIREKITKFEEYIILFLENIKQSTEKQ